ncbi:MAG: hypothetical protein JSS30_07445 [Verrucomicrobia bacterium]|nr:hypothetical protein [Verrucomicrobiota bacterium]
MEELIEDTHSKPQQKLRFALDSMKQILSSETTPVFKDFWEAKRACLELFKEKLPPHIRTLYWNEYVEMTDALRQVKALLDEQSSFAEEQIDLAIQAIEHDLENFEVTLGDMSGIELPSESKFLLQNGAKYIRLQKELDLFNTFAGRLNGLRKELMQTQMRIRNKNKLFQKLSKLGDLVFPKRKEGIKALSELFVADVERFIIGFNSAKGPYFGLKDEIKAMQKFAKLLTLSTGAFNQTREKLSSCWDQIRDKEAQHREQREEEKGRFKHNFEQFAPQIETFKAECAELKLSSHAADTKIEELVGAMKDLGFGINEIKGIKKQLFDAKKVLEEKENEDRKKAAEAEEFEKQRQANTYHALLEEIQEVLDQADVLPLNTLVEKWEAFLKEEKALKIMGLEKAVLENRLGSIADSIQEKKWKSALEQSPEEMVSSLNMLLSERHKEKRKLKEALESHRKIVGGSALNFEQSLQYQELLREEKFRLDTIETMVEEIEEKLFDLEE